MSVDLSVSNPELLKTALDKMKLRHITLSNGAIEITTRQGRIVIDPNREQQVINERTQGVFNEIKCGYSDESVYAVAEQLGYSVVEEEEDCQQSATY